MAVKLLDSRTDRALVHRNIFISVSDTYFCHRLSKLQELELLEELRQLITFVDLIGSRTRDLPACRIMPQLLRHRVPQ
jgi:hypothetical protein